MGGVRIPQESLSLLSLSLRTRYLLEKTRGKGSQGEKVDNLHVVLEGKRKAIVGSRERDDVRWGRGWRIAALPGDRTRF
jgi:hypothetical protein